ncbi:MAG: TonB-dependent receptor plug domain-containing protein [Bacteroidota bacterium]|nr:TonB-dependent receptor plug domain-containing protein [Bacteroidota bacterium]
MILITKTCPNKQVNKLLCYSFLIACILAPSLKISAQKINLSGYIKDESNGETISGAVVKVKGIRTGAYTNNYGRFSLRLDTGKFVLLLYGGGFKPKAFEMYLVKDTNINFTLDPDIKTTEVEVRSDNPRQQLDQTQMSKVELNIAQIKQLPALFGEVDILKTIQLLPGIQSGNEGSTGFYVRGGGPDQNLILLDEAVVYNASHLFGFFSVFNSDAIRNVELYKGGYPAQYGGRLSSVIDISLKDGNNKKIEGAGGIGLIASRLTIEGPIVKDKSSFIISGRRTYFDVFTRAINSANKDKKDYNPIPNYYFYDLNAKVNYILGDKDRLYLSGYFGRDVFGFSGNGNTFNFGFKWGNSTGTARWNHVYNNKLFSNATVTYTDYKYSIETKLSNFRFNVGSQIQDWTGKLDYEWSPLEKHSIKFGANYTYHTFGVGNAQIASTDGDFNIDFDDKRFGSELGTYINDDWDISEKLKLSTGLRLSGFVNKDIFYPGVEPRVSTRYKLDSNTSLKLSYTGMQQYVQLVSNSGASLPTDIWYPSGKVVKPQYAQQIAAGITKLLFKDRLTVTNEVFYKTLSNQLDYRDAANIFLNDNLDAEFVFGKGWSYGNELFIQKQSGRFTGWIGYTLSWTWRQFDAINGGEKFHPKFDQRHYLSLVGSYDVSKRVTISSTFVYGTGNVTTLPVAYYITNDFGNGSLGLVPVVDKRNNTRLAPYARLDFALVWKFNPKWGKSDLTFSVYNALNRKNPFFLFINSEFSGNGAAGAIPSNITAQQVSLFPIIPSITYNFKF